ncbi:hypothetical protein CBL_02368 [Carabus blaptoides fortunei]
MDQDSESNEPGQCENIPPPINIKMEEIIIDDDEPIIPKIEQCDEIYSWEHRIDTNDISDRMEHNSDAFSDTSDDSLLETSHADMFQTMKRQSYKSANRTASKTQSTQCPMCQRNYSTSNLKAHIMNAHIYRHPYIAMW